MTTYRVTYGEDSQRLDTIEAHGVTCIDCDWSFEDEHWMYELVPIEETVPA